MPFYVINILYAVFSLGLYAGFRAGINCYLRHNKNSKTFIRKSKKGLANYWLYRKLHNELNLGCIYYFNMLLLIITPVYFVATVFLGWIEIMEIPISIVGFLLCGLQIPAYIIAHIYNNYEEHGKPFILLKKTKDGMRYDSSLPDFLMMAIMAAFSIYNFIIAIH